MHIEITASIVAASPDAADSLRPALAARGVSLHVRAVDKELREVELGSDVLIAFPENLDVSPQLLTERARVLGDLPLVVISKRPSLADGTSWYALGAYDYVAADDLDRLALVLQRIAQKRGSGWGIASNLLQTIIDAVPAPIFFKDFDGRYLGCNQAFFQSVGPSPEEIIGKTVYDIAPKELADIYHKADQDLLAAGGKQVYESQARFSDGSLHDIMFHKAVFRHGDGTPGGLVGVMLDITDRKQLEAQLERLATLDPLTEAYNRRSFMRLARSECSRATRHRRPVSIVVLDIDHFKDVNDTYGHAAGDEVLRQVVRTARSHMREHDVFARAGGEEFYVLLSETSSENAVSISERLCRDLANQIVEFEGHRIAVTVSAGVAECRLMEVCRDNCAECDPTDRLDDCLRSADKALYEAKRRGRDRVVAFPFATAG